MPSYSIRVGKNDPIFLESDDPLETVIDNVLTELYGKKEEVSHEEC